MRLLTTGLLVLWITATANAQESYSLQQCIDYALEHSATVKNANLDYNIARSKVKETTAIGLPQISGKWDLAYNPKIQQNFVLASNFNPFAPDDSIVSFAFGLNFNSNASATLTQLIFDGSYLVGLQAAKVYTELAEKGIAKSKTDVVINVQKAYYLVLISQERQKQIEESQKMLEQLMVDTKALSEVGFAEETDLKRVMVNLNNLKAELQKLNSFEQISMNMLKFQMGMPVTQNIILSESLSSKTASMTATSSTTNYENRIELKILNVQYELNELSVKNEKITILPSLAAFGTIGANYGSNSFGDVVQLGNYKNYSMLGLSLQVPIWSSGQRKFRIEQASAESEKINNNKEMLLNSFALETEQTQSTLENNIEILKVREENLQLAQEVYDNSQIKYKEGVGSSFEVTSAQNDLKTAQTDYYSALYDAIIAKIDLDKTNGIFNVE